MIVTRFNPTTNGSLHLGHLYTLLVNEQFAHAATGGFFYVRFDDTSQAITVEMKDIDRVPQIIRQQEEDINWLGIKVDGWSKQSDLTEKIYIKIRDTFVMHPLLRDIHPHYLPTIIRSGNTCIPYPYTPYQTLERVFLDNALGVTHVIRGEDFVTEYSLYRYFCERLEFPYPKFIFLPRLMSKSGDISKTNGGYKISDMRSNGYTPQQVIDLLVKACLFYPENGWDIYNLKPNPQLDT